MKWRKQSKQKLLFAFCAQSFFFQFVKQNSHLRFLLTRKGGQHKKHQWKEPSHVAQEFRSPNLVGQLLMVELVLVAEGLRNVWWLLCCSMAILYHSGWNVYFGWYFAHSASTSHIPGLRADSKTTDNGPKFCWLLFWNFQNHFDSSDPCQNNWIFFDRVYKEWTEATANSLTQKINLHSKSQRDQYKHKFSHWIHTDGQNLVGMLECRNNGQICNVH